MRLFFLVGNSLFSLNVYRFPDIPEIVLYVLLGFVHDYF